MHTHTYATAIKEKEVMNFKESKMGYMEGSRQRKGKEDIMEFYYNFKKNELIRKHKKTLASQSNHEKKKKTLVGVSPYLLCLKLYCRATVMKRQNQHKNRHLDQWNTSSNYKPTHLQPLDFWGKKRCQDIL